MPKLLEMTALPGMAVAADAMHCRRRLSRQVSDQQGLRAHRDQDGQHQRRCGPAAVGKITASRQDGGRNSIESRYCLLSRAFPAERFNQTAQAHRGGLELPNGELSSANCGFHKPTIADPNSSLCGELHPVSMAGNRAHSSISPRLFSNRSLLAYAVSVSYPGGGPGQTPSSPKPCRCIRSTNP